MSVAQIHELRFWPGNSARPALDGVSLEFAAGELVILDGPSGSGKSTLLRALSGLVPHFHGGRFAGRVTVLGHDTRHTTPAAMAAVVGSVFQEPETQAVRASVARDVAFGLENLGTPVPQIAARIDDALRRVGALHLRDRAVAGLSAGERQRVAIAGALATRPRMLLLDEPTSQLDERAVALLRDTLRDLATDGTSIVVAEHHVDRLVSVADRVVTLVDGRVAALAQPVVTTATQRPGGPPVLVVDAVEAGYAERPVLTGATLQLEAGTITALHGANGAGKSTLARVVAGLITPTHGRVWLDDRDITTYPAERRHPQIGLLRHDAGRWLVTERVRDEVASACGHLPIGAREGVVETALGELDLGDLAEAHPLDLSVGERERVALACVLAARPRVIVLDEPSRGMDPARRAALAAALERRADEGAAVLVITHDDALADAIACRHVELVEGRVVDRRQRVMR